MVSFINQPTPALRLSTVAFYAAMEYHPRFKLHAIVFHCQSPFQKSRCFLHKYTIKILCILSTINIPFVYTSKFYQFYIIKVPFFCD